jgi:hypothetical protein
MFIFSIKQQQPKGEIGLLHLGDWWLSVFTKDERNYIEKVYKPLGCDSNYSLAKGELSDSGQRPLLFLTVLSGWFDNKRDGRIAEKIINKAEDFVSVSSPIDLHFYYNSQIKMNYKKRRDDSSALERTKYYCRKQIAIAAEVAKYFFKDNPILPFHEGYAQLCIILEKQVKYEEAIKLAQQAQNQGWGAGWNSVIERCNKKIQKLII